MNSKLEIAAREAKALLEIIDEDVPLDPELRRGVQHVVLSLGNALIEIAGNTEAR